MRTESNLGAKVRVLRRGQRMTQVELARRLGISPSYLNLIEHNRRSFTADLLWNLCFKNFACTQAFRVTPGAYFRDFGQGIFRVHFLLQLFGKTASKPFFGDPGVFWVSFWRRIRILAASS